MKKFTANDETFICEVCGKQVNKLVYTSRDHCPYCLHSKHVDIQPGDRLNSCQGILEPIGIEIKGSKTQIVYRCKKCKCIKKNVVASDDNNELLIELSKLSY